MGAMEGTDRTRWAKRAQAPMAQELGPWSGIRRLRLVRDGIVECLRACPKANKSLQGALQRAWAQANADVEAMEAEEGREWQPPSLL